MPIRHGLPTAADGDTIPTADRASGRAATPGHRVVLADEHRWPFYVLDQIEYLANRLSTPRLPAAVLDPAAPVPTPGHDGCAESESEGEGLTVPYVLAVLGPKTAPADLVDRAWRYLITTTRQRRGLWNLYSLGLARLGLHKTADALTPKQPPSVKQNVQQLIAAEFLIEMHRTEADDAGRQVYAFELDKPFIYARLRDHCIYAATKRRWARHARDRQNLNLDQFAHLYEAVPGGNTLSRQLHLPGRRDPYAVLARLVAETATKRHGQRLTAGDAALIALTHLVGHPLAQAAAILGLPEPTARMRAHRARTLIARLLHYEPASHTSHATDATDAQPSTQAGDPD